MSPSTRYAKKQAKARQRRRLQAHARLERDRRQAQRAAEALHHALEELSLPAHLVVELEGRLRSQHQRLGKMVGVRLPACFGCRTPSEWWRVRGWDTQWPSRMLGALPTRFWLKRLWRLGLEVLEPLWRHVRDMSPATQSRWQWTWVWDDAVFQKLGNCGLMHFYIILFSFGKLRHCSLLSLSVFCPTAIPIHGIITYAKPYYRTRWP